MIKYRMGKWGYWQMCEVLRFVRFPLRYMKIKMFSRDIETGDINNISLGHHGLGTVISRKVKIGKNAVIHHSVTIGGKEGRHPTIGNNVIIFPSAIIVGGIKVGDNSIIGAGSFIDKDIPPDSVVHPKQELVIKKRGEKFSNVLNRR